MTDGIGIATHQFASTVEAAIQLLERRKREAGDVPSYESSRPAYDRWVRQLEQATVQAADSIFQAEKVFSRACLRELSARAGGPAVAVQARSAGDAIIRFAACTLVGIVPLTSSDFRVRQLADIARQLGGIRGDASR